MDGPRKYHTKWSKSDRERQISYDTTNVWNLKHDINEHIYKTEIDSRHRKQIYGFQQEWLGMNEEFGINVLHTIIYKVDNKQGPTVYHKELCSVSCNNL